MDARPGGLKIESVGLTPSGSPPSLDTTQQSSSSSTSLQESRSPSAHSKDTPNSSPASSSAEGFEKPEEERNDGAGGQEQREPRFQRRVTFPASPVSGSKEIPNGDAVPSVAVNDRAPDVGRFRRRMRRQRFTWLRWLQICCEFLLDHAFPILGLAVGAVGLLFFGWRQLRLASAGVQLQYIQICQGWDEDKFGKRDEACEEYFHKSSIGQLRPPYHIHKRALKSVLEVEKRILLSHADGAWKRMAHKVPVRQDQRMFRSSNTLMVVMVLLIIAFLLLVVMMQRTRQQAREGNRLQRSTQERVQNLARAEYLGQDYRVKKHRPQKQEDLYKLGQWLQSSRTSSSTSLSSASVNTSTDSLSPNEIRRRSTPRRVNIRHTPNDEEEACDGLIELPSKGNTKIFFEPDTGAFIRLSPWTGQMTDDEDSDEDTGRRAKLKHALQRVGSGMHTGQTKQAIARMGSGAVALGAGKGLGDEIKEEIQGFEDNIKSFMSPAGTSMQGMMLQDPGIGKSHAI
ncbi:uncharacterized protein KY384_004715 [Bacidia gigantensis]|uniref:uncharacterized protein n=1 Tax=Bacidia gigantensis TaxID=2732470 RepID=UPI001D05B9A3|nr:uncharacterized protein KY384_004715 [Bacidia gigantensis]KAG8530215.1 hypothetical protein KY384_004715 [Bacidia gigantensis]